MGVDKITREKLESFERRIDELDTNMAATAALFGQVRNGIMVVKNEIAAVLVEEEEA